MPVRIGTNVSSLVARNRLNESFENREHALRSLASGKRVVNASDDAAGFAISENLRGQKHGIQMSQRNTQDAISFVQVAEGSLNEQNNILIRMRELAIQSASDTVSDKERSFLNKEFKQLSQELDRIANSTSFGRSKLLNGEEKSFQFQVGPNSGDSDRIEYDLTADARASSLGVARISVDKKRSALRSMDNIDKAIDKVSSMRADFGAIQSRLHTASSHLMNQHESISAAHSQMADTDVAQATAKLAQANILSEIGVAVLAQANSNPHYAQRLILSL